jgi:hypothetical protein
MEQEAMRLLLKDKEAFGKRAIQVPQSWFDAYPAPDPFKLCSDDGFSDDEDLPDYFTQPGYFMVHIVGSAKYRPGCFEHLLKLAEGSNSEWHSEAAAASLKREVDIFWDNQFLGF